MGIRVHPHTVTPLQVGVIFWKIGLGLSPSDVAMSRLRLQTPWTALKKRSIGVLLIPSLFMGACWLPDYIISGVGVAVILTHPDLSVIGIRGSSHPCGNIQDVVK